MWKAKSAIKEGDVIKFINKHCVRRAKCSEICDGVASHSCNKNKYLKSVYDIIIPLDARKVSFKGKFFNLCQKNKK
jgi:hypothetical protein